MSTPRTRRNKPQQITDLLAKLRHSQRAEVVKRQVALEEALAELAKTERAIEALSMERLPGMEEPPEPPVGIGPIGASTSDTEGIVLNVPDAVNMLSLSNPRRQRIGEKAQDKTTSGITLADCPGCEHELPWHYEGCPVVGPTLGKETA